MSSSERQIYPFRVSLVDHDGSVAHDTLLTIFDGDDRSVVSGEGEVSLELPAGLYVVRAERPGTFTEEVVRHSGVTSHVLKAPKRYSTVPSTDVHLTDPDDAARAVRFSAEKTTDPLELDGTPSGELFVYVRHPDPETATGGAQTLSLHTLDGGLVTRFTGAEEGRNWFAFNAEATPGLYLLRRSDDRPREMAIWVYDGWATQAFMLHSDRPLLHGTSQILAPKGQGFTPDDRSARLTDLAMQGLVNTTDTVPIHEITDLLYGKFRNPMFGLLGAHLALRTGHSFIDMGTVIENLTRMIGNVPDVQALRIAMARQSGDPVEGQPIMEPPGLDAGFETLVAATAEVSHLIPDDSPLVQIALQRYADSAWTNWRPYRRPGSDRGAVLGMAPEDATPMWVTNYLEAAMVQSARRGEDLDLSTAVSISNIPASSLAQAYESVRSGSEAGLERTIEMERIISTARRSDVAPGVTADDLTRQFLEGSEEKRIEALGLMQGHEDVRSFGTVLEGISKSRSAFEQYHALRLAHEMLPYLSDDEKESLKASIETQRGSGGWIEEGTDRWSLSSRVLTGL